MSIRGSDCSWAPHTADTQADLKFNTWCSANAHYAQLASRRASPHAIGPRALHGAARKKDRASIPILDRVAVAGAVATALIGASSLLVGIGYWFI